MRQIIFIEWRIILVPRIKKSISPSMNQLIDASLMIKYFIGMLWPDGEGFRLAIVWLQDWTPDHLFAL